ncbi:DUF72 domain-containing protein [Sediminicurvatus halobius]|uniref:DUF72 domain-containing protein n=1 Tax=Sediminicurvatus halobius TaxID=2182432 RepID=A0A2U2N5L0_9GAMM|nr:DUF72 domain-containing protein [Spiribacter halobius]PWG64357.1 DUF72 domain-containing protein [Spiribacter halobius]UEX79295.1 DUF72 domain-containing protein [Spiribacter halobius]
MAAEERNGAVGVRVATAGWRLPPALQPQLPGPGTHLARYARHLPGTEINASFYRPQRRALYAKWAGETGPGFRFAVKMPRALTHHQRLRGIDGLDEFLAAIAGLGKRLGPLLLQLPPSLRFEAAAVDGFLAALRERHAGPVACEPRHASWFDGAADQLLAQHRVARVAADPPVTEGADEPGGWPGLVYFRLHGRPRRFYSAYGEADLARLAARLQAQSGEIETWCVFNNTATDAGLTNALDLHSRLQGTPASSGRGT